MLNSLPLITVMILSLFLAFYCVDSHKNNIVTLVNMDEKSIESVSVEVEKTLTKKEVKVPKTAETVYVEVLAMEDTNDTSKVISEVESKSETVAKENSPVEMKQETEVIEKVEAKQEVKVEIEKTVDSKITSEYSEGYKLDDLEKMIMEELKKGNKD